jgi:predicted short-subunit dehydrogenase-like oxidoreductase (DUF2520 family)
MMVPMSEPRKIGFIGAGMAGTVLALALERIGFDVVAVASRTRASASALAGRLIDCRVTSPQEVADLADLVFVTTPDDAIEPVVRSIDWRAGGRVVHCSGATTTAVLEPARVAGSLVGGFHPLQTFASVENALASLTGTTFAVEAAEPLAGELFSLAERLGGRAFSLRSEDKILYHAAAVIASNYLVVLARLATDLWREFGVDQAEATAALLPLFRGTLGNLDRVGLPRCLTGPIARGDVGTICQHLEALADRAPSILPAYRLLGSEAVPIAREKGTLDPDLAERLLALLNVSDDKVLDSVSDNVLAPKEEK